ncbi:MAG: exodeoxyribonuclease III [Candidatus Omnitrophota bacterium]
MRILSWNVNGIRAAGRKGFTDWLSREDADVVCVQETKARPDQLTQAILEPDGYTSFWSSAERRGYSGVAVYSKQQPQKVTEGLGAADYDSEGRVLQLDYEAFTLFNVYFPNGGRGNARVPFKMGFYDAFLERVNALKKDGRPLIICGDVNTAHTEIDLARPRQNIRNTGFLPEERQWITKFIENGYVDTFRHVYPDQPGHYTWWDYKTRARERDVGWRIDYFFITPDLMTSLKDAFILKSIMGSDHCPIGIEVAI